MTRCANDGDRSAELRRWAAAQLDLPGYVSSEQAQLAFWRQLGDKWEFAPPAAWHDVAAVFARSTLDDIPDNPGSSNVRRMEQDSLRAQIESFAKEFFSLSTGERNSRWQALMKRAGDAPHLVGRLSFLALGLSVHPPRKGTIGKRANELTHQILKMFVLRPAERVYARQMFVASTELDPAGWESAANELKRWAPNVAALEEGLIEELTTWKSRRELSQKKARQPSTPLIKRIRSAVSVLPLPMNTRGLYIALILVSVVGRLLIHSDQQPQSKIRLNDTDRARIQQATDLYEWTKEQARIAKELGIAPPPGSENDVVDSLTGKSDEVRARWQKWHAERAAQSPSKEPVAPEEKVSTEKETSPSTEGAAAP